MKEKITTKLVRFDWAIKYLLRHKANFDILEGFLSELLKIDIQIKAVLESEGNKNHAKDKYNRVDLLVKTAEDQNILIEIQCDGQWDYLSRILYGASTVVYEHLRESDAYKSIRKVISVSIVFFNLGTGKDYLYRGTTSFTGVHYGDTLNLNPKERAIYETAHITPPQTPEDIFPEYYLIKVSQFQDKVQNKIDEWIYFLKNSEIKTEFTAKGLQLASEKLNVLKLSEQERRAYAHYREGLHDDASLAATVEVEKKFSRAEGLAQGLAQGLKQGLAQGQEQEHQKIIKIAKSLKKTGLPLAEISAHTGLSLEVIESL